MVRRLLSRHDIGYAGVLSGVGGWVDAATYLRFGAFSGAMSGNTVPACGAAVHRFTHLVLALPAIAVVGVAIVLRGPQNG
ncbi:MAG TPA: DUF1275 family protein [Steroidobacteraceae bacterium]|jgi:uncharacterized membrane protein YoaK (UPF0700 family)|nr:DUF1275 family protein [Steroidobacteraceae bacterium]